MNNEEYKAMKRQEVIESTIDNMMTIWHNEENYETEVKCSLYSSEIQKMSDKLQAIEEQNTSVEGVFYEVYKKPAGSDELGEFIFIAKLESLARKAFEEMRTEEENENYTFTLAKTSNDGSNFEVLDTFTK